MLKHAEAGIEKKYRLKMLFKVGELRFQIYS
ncbi:MAG: hypothetical protein JWM14_1741 [Chitinophagaceae bacterium]|nr:hypothetical protein [Chitinophagaceae bacterium]